MSDELEIISDGEGLALFGDQSSIERFLSSTGLASKEIDLARFAPKAATGAHLAQSGIETFASHGRWVKLTKDSAAAMKNAPLMKGPNPETARAIVVQGSGRTKHILQIVKSPVVHLTNPAILAAGAGIISQYAMQKQMEEITSYLKQIDAKVDQVLRAVKDTVIAEMIGVDLVIEEALAIREEIGRVSEVVWSKVQGTALAIAKVQGYALRQLEAVTEQVEGSGHVDDLASIAKSVELSIREWLAVLAQTVRLQDGVGILELDRVLDASPEELNKHRIGLYTAREKRRELIVGRTRTLIQRMAVTAQQANTKVLLNPISAKTVVETSNRIAADVAAFLHCFGVEIDDSNVDAKRWRVAASEAGDKALEIGTAGVDAAAKAGAMAAEKSKVLASGIAGKFGERFPRKKRSIEDAGD